MEKIGEGLYRIDYYTSEYEVVLQVLDHERNRISSLGYLIITYSISLSETNNILVFYLHLYFKSKSDKDLTYKDLFGNY